MSFWLKLNHLSTLTSVPFILLVQSTHILTYIHTDMHRSFSTDTHPRTHTVRLQASNGRKLIVRAETALAGHRIADALQCVFGLRLVTPGVSIMTCLCMCLSPVSCADIARRIKCLQKTVR